MFFMYLYFGFRRLFTQFVDVEIIIVSCCLVVFSGIKKYIVGLIIKTSSEAESLEKEKVYLGKLNMILVQVQFNFKFNL